MMTGTRDGIGQANWLDVDGSESQAWEPLKDFEHTEVVVKLLFRYLPWRPGQHGPEGQSRRWGIGRLFNHLEKNEGGLSWAT